MTGTLAALACALSWAIAARLFRVLGSAFSPLALNFWKGALSVALLAIISLLYFPLGELEQHVIFWLLLSGIIGIGIGDTFFFLALNKIGDSQSILVAETLAPIATALLAMVWIAEWLTWPQWLGIAIVLVCVDLVIKVQRQTALADMFEITGYLFAGLAALCQAIGAVISRDVLLQSDIDPFNASMIRLIGGISIVVVLILIRKQSFMPRTGLQLKTWATFAVATLVGTFLALSLQMLAFSLTKAAIVQTLFATSIIFSLIIARLLGEVIRFKTILWSMGALVGVGILLISS
jgi:drug/metabolite transporter (DMT)-like permease